MGLIEKNKSKNGIKLTKLDQKQFQNKKKLLVSRNQMINQYL